MHASPKGLRDYTKASNECHITSLSGIEHRRASLILLALESPEQDLRLTTPARDLEAMLLRNRLACDEGAGLGSCVG